MFDWSGGLPDGVAADVRATKAPSVGPATEVVWDVVGFGCTLEPGGTCPFVTGGSPLVSPAGAVCAQVLVAPLVGDPTFRDALSRMRIHVMTLLDFVADGDAAWLDTVALTYLETVPTNASSGSLLFRSTEMPPGLVPVDFEPPGGLPPPRFGGTPGGQVPPAFLPPTTVPEPATIGLLGLGLLGLAVARRRAAR
ncbi:PEP-CTERM sorting domain-containing protein [Elioraea tepidiphila]|uniref:PEP-CTERM sorting domain-containing protein n=1 Tax=Elioraea tepidiphila TaxID=457934 RepID=UPI00036F1E15|nr:PEP-CTERM sorting domain-containing protein [Elioraea tepidiphila]